MTKLVALGQKGPPPPDFWAASWAILMAPMDGTDERITVLLAAQSAAGDWLIEYALLPEALTALFQDDALDVSYQIEMVGQALLAHVEHEPISTWEPPLSGFYTSPPRHYGADTLINVMRMSKIGMAYWACPGCRLPVDPAQAPSRCWKHIDLADFKPKRERRKRS